MIGNGPVDEIHDHLMPSAPITAARPNCGSFAYFRVEMISRKIDFLGFGDQADVWPNTAGIRLDTRVQKGFLGKFLTTHELRIRFCKLLSGPFLDF